VKIGETNIAFVGASYRLILSSSAAANVEPFAQNLSEENLDESIGIFTKCLGMQLHIVPREAGLPPAFVTRK
jgi:hypothetical protein